MPHSSMQLMRLAAWGLIQSPSSPPSRMETSKLSEQVSDRASSEAAGMRMRRAPSEMPAAKVSRLSASARTAASRR